MQNQTRTVRRATACLLLALGIGGIARAETVGNPLNNDYAQGNDGIAALTIFDVGSNFAIPSAGVITAGEIHSGSTSGGAGTGSGFSLLLLDPISTSDGATTYEVLDRADGNGPGSGVDGNVSLTGLDWNVTTNDVLAYWGYAAAYSFTPGPGAGTFITSTNDMGGSNLSANDPADGSQFTVYPNGTDSVNYSAQGERNYAVQFTFEAPEPGPMAMFAVGGLALLGIYHFRFRNA